MEYPTCHSYQCFGMQVACGIFHGITLESVTITGIYLKNSIFEK